MLVCAIAMPAFSQKDQLLEQDSAQSRKLKGCGTPDKEVNYLAETDKSTHPTGEQPANKALLYIIRNTNSVTSSSLQSKLAVDGEWKGVNLKGTYFFFTLEPGLHYFCSQAKTRSVLVLTAEAGKTYYIEQQVSFKGGRTPLNNLIPLSDADGKSMLALSALSTWKIQ
jgi:hypothetical protein